LRAAAYAEVQRIVREHDPPPPSTRLSSLSADVRDGVAAARRTRFEELARQLRRELEWIPLKAMRKDRTERYRTASELADDVRNYLAGRPLIAAPESAWYRFKKNVRRHRGPVAAASAVALALLAGLVVSTVLAVRLKRTADAESRQRELALAETARKSAVLTFLTDTIGRVRTAGGDVTLVNILGEAAKALDAGRGFRDQPDLEAEIRLSVAQAYQALADHAPAQAQALAALAIRRRLYGEHHPAYAAALNELGVLRAAQGNLADAEQRLLEAIAINRSHPSARPSDLAGNLSNLAMVLHELDGKQAQAEQAYNEALRICRGLGDNERVATVLNNLGDLLRTAGRMNEAQQHLTEAVRLRRQLLGPRHPDLAKSLNNLALVLRSRNRLEEAEPLYREALTIERGVWGPTHPAVLTDQFNLGAMLREQERLDEAEPILREVVQLRRQTIGPEHKDLAASVNALGDLLRGQGRLDEAEPLILEGLSMRRKLAGPDDASVGTSLLTLAMLRRDQTRLGEAQRAARDAMRILEQKRRPGHYLRALGASVLGEILGQQGRFDEAQPLLLTGFNELQQNGDAAPARRREAIARLVALYQSWGKSDETDRWRDVLRDFDRDHRLATRPATRTVVAPTTTARSIR
jgi:tetratricopeptide (TPR) repeat protein